MIQQNIGVTTDCCIFFRAESCIKILLVQRKKDPFAGEWALPGGFLEEHETFEAGAKRELEEETGLRIGQLVQLSTYGSPGRDPRGRTITIAFLGEVFTEVKVEGADDAADARWFDIRELPALAFDHAEIIEEAFARYSDLKGITL